MTRARSGKMSSKARKRNKRHRNQKNAGSRRSMRILPPLIVAAAALIIIVNLFSVIFGEREKGDPEKIAVAMVRCAENSTFDYTENYSYIENIGDGAGYTGGIIGFTTMTGDMLHVVRDYCDKEDDAALEKYIPALERAVGSKKTKGLGKGFIKEWKNAGKTESMREVQNSFRDRLFLDPAFDMAENDGLSTLGKYIYYDTAVQHGPEGEGSSLANIRKAAKNKAKPPAAGGDEKAYLKAFIDIREKSLKKMKFKVNLSRIEVQKKLVLDEEFDMLLPLEFTMYGYDYELKESDLI